MNEALSKVNYGLRKKIFSQETIGYYASGFRRNYLLVISKEKFVALSVVRNSREYNRETDGFNDFLRLASGSV